jgi:hypothetical protein
METLFIISGVILGIILLSFGFYLTEIKRKKNEFKDWEIDDLLILNAGEYKNKLRENGMSLAKLKGWSENHLYIDVGDGSTHQVSWDELDANKSAIWRRNVKECEAAMGKKPAFGGTVYDGKKSDVDSGDKIDGKPIILLTEVECQAYLVKAISNEDYKLAEKIKKQMEKYR